MANSATTVPEDVMKLFVQSFAQGAGAVEGAQRIGLQRTAQAQEFQLGTKRLELQAQELQQQKIDTQAKIALQRENIASDAALKGQEISARVQESAKGFLLKQQAMEQDRLNFSQQIRAQKATEEAKRLALAANVDQLEKQNKIEEAKIQMAKESGGQKFDARQAALSQQSEKFQQERNDQKNKLILREFHEAKKEAYDSTGFMIKPEYANPDKTLNNDKIYEIAKSRVNRLMDPSGGTTQTYPERQSEQPAKAPDAPSKEGAEELGPLSILTEKIRRALTAAKSGETVVVDGNTYKKK